MMFEYTGDGCSVPKDVVSVQFKEGLQTIWEDAFCWRSSLKSITSLPSTVTEIGKNAFSSCHILRVVTLNEGLKKIGRQHLVTAHH